jgi:small subunit ribosomal protein S1
MDQVTSEVEEVASKEASTSEATETAAEAASGSSETPMDRGSFPIVELDLPDEEIDKAIDATLPRLEEGDIVTGTVVKVDRDEVLVDIGYKSEGVIPAKELSIRHDVDPRDIVSPGERIEALVLQKEDAEGRLVLSKKRAQYEKAWVEVEKIRETTGVVAGEVVEVVKGGLILDIGLRGFLPASLVDLRKVKDLHSYLGQVLECKIIELDRNRNNVVLSRKAYLEEAQREARSAFLKSLKPGERRKGVVSSVVSFGVFVDLGGMDGLVHVSEISWRHVDHPSEVVKVGDEVEVEVKEVDEESQKISLSMKACQEDPWEVFAREHDEGAIVEGVVTKIVPYGAFVEVADGIEGLVHISEMAHFHVKHPEQVVSVGETVRAKILNIDLPRRRISLSIKQALEEEGRGIESVEGAEGGTAEQSSEEAVDNEAPQPEPGSEGLESEALAEQLSQEAEEGGASGTEQLSSVPLETETTPSEAVQAIASEIGSETSDS